MDEKTAPPWSRPRGLGDVIHTAAEATGIKKIVDIVGDITGKPCNCPARREALNKLFSFENDREGA